MNSRAIVIGLVVFVVASVSYLLVAPVELYERLRSLRPQRGRAE
jgi:hypothetical protein